MLVDQYPGAQLGQESQILQLVRSGDIDFAIVSSANTSTISPQAGVMSLHFLFRSAEHDIKALGDQKVFEAVRDMIDDTVQGIHAIALGTQGFRHMYGKKEVHKVDDLKGYKVRVQAYRDRRYDVLPPMAPRPCICRSAASIRHCKPAWWISARTPSTSTSSTSITKSPPYSR